MVISEVEPVIVIPKRTCRTRIPSVTMAMDSPSDGTVRVEETRLPGVSEHIVLPVSHTGMLFSDVVARAAARFLNTARFG